MRRVYGARSKGQKLGRPKVRRDRDQDAKVIRRMRDEGGVMPKLLRTWAGQKLMFTELPRPWDVSQTKPQLLLVSR
jgi:hypothetical protein